jgi:hypothetical protein
LKQPRLGLEGPLATKKEKSPQVRKLEKKLSRPLVVSDDESIMGWFRKTCCNVDEDGEIAGLNLFRCNIRDVSFLTGMTRLTSLNLSDNNISDWSFLKGLTRLTALYLSDNNISDGSFLAGLTGLTSLNLRNNNISDGSFLTGLTGLTSLILRRTIFSIYHLW